MLDNKVVRERLIDDFDCKESQADGVVEKNKQACSGYLYCFRVMV